MTPDKMMRRNKPKALSILIFSTFIMVMFLSAPHLHGISVEEERFKNENEHVEKISETVLSDNELFLTNQKLATFETGYFFLRETTDKTGRLNFISSFDIPGSKLLIRYRDKDKKLIAKDLSKGGLAPTVSELYVETDACHMYLGQANQLIELGEGLYRKEPAQPIIITKKTDNSYNIKLTFNANHGAKNISWGLISRERLLNFKSEVMRFLYQGYDLQQRAILGYDGYMYLFEKREGDVYFLIPSPYLASSFVKSGGSKLGDIFGQILLKLAAENINAEGYIPVIPMSNWLSQDYGIQGGYFDNRWNADLAITMMTSVRKQNDEELKAAYQKILKYYLKHIDNNSFAADNGGLLNYDYGMSNEKIKTHISLNHQLNLINMLYEAYLQEKDDVYLNYAEKLLKGVEFIGMGWVMEDGELHYALMPDGSLGLKDYDLLTYNDALLTRKYMMRIYGQSSTVLEEIINKKFEWIKNKGYAHLYR